MTCQKWPNLWTDSAWPMHIHTSEPIQRRMTANCKKWFNLWANILMNIMLCSIYIFCSKNTVKWEIVLKIELKLIVICVHYWIILTSHPKFTKICINGGSKIRVVKSIKLEQNKHPSCQLSFSLYFDHIQWLSIENQQGCDNWQQWRFLYVDHLPK